MKQTTDIVVPEVATKEPPMKKAEFHRDMRRLKDLRDQFDSPGLNTFESNEVDRLLNKYEIDRVGMWSRREMFSND